MNYKLVAVYPTDTVSESTHETIYGVVARFRELAAMSEVKFSAYLYSNISGDTFFYNFELNRFVEATDEQRHEFEELVVSTLNQ